VQTLQRGLLEVRMDFDLVDGRHDGGLGTQLLEMFDPFRMSNRLRSRLPSESVSADQRSSSVC
jgi:hypothetical protein